MRVIRAKSAGFCLGVSLAVKRLDRELEGRGTRRETGAAGRERGRLITLGPIIHNPLLMRRYAGAGVVCDDDPEELRPEDRVVIRAHGIPRDMEEKLRMSGAGLVDATCPKVKKAQLAIGEAKEGVLLLFGEKEHPEVRGLISYAGPRAFVFGTLDELRALVPDPDADYCLAAQTTQDREVFLEAGKYLRERLGGRVRVLDTICQATKARQSEVLEMCRKVASLVVVGGFNSGNTRRLAEVALSAGVFALHVEQPSDFAQNALQRLAAGGGPIGVSAGASTPAEQIDEVCGFLERL
ncbi:MAG: 4-hydroxy-3-methylbut-2-enyl diphosphate reductase [Desulfovibrio sp.]|jgi:4-hydroxy-3-methylbut-2-enyl diphosphate reductase|nr:4-hydroxy-3-methylbut-2-enyl diphosphate reductase [Desulfovibrio sp.]